jgi:hypothetical protein
MRWLSKNRFGLTLAGIALAGLLLHIFYPEDWRFHSTFHVLADALIVAGISGFTVDASLHRALIRDVWHVLLGHALPDEIRNYLRNIAETSLVRRNWRAEFRFQKDGDKLVVDVTESWELFNYGSGSRPYKSHMAVNLIDNPSPDRLQCEISQAGRKTRRYAATELNNRNHRQSKGTRVIYRADEVSLEAQDIEDRRTTAACSVKWQYRITKNSRDFILMFSASHPAIGLVISCYQDCGLRFEFDQEEMDHAADSSDWRFPWLLAPQQQFCMRWYPEAEVPTPLPSLSAGEDTGQAQS